MALEEAEKKRLAALQEAENKRKALKAEEAAAKEAKERVPKKKKVASPKPKRKRESKYLIPKPPKEESEEEEGFLEKCMPECLKRNIPRILLVLVVTWGLTSDTLLSVWDVVSDYILAAKHFR